ncbi:uncharacterized protein [Odocoileus virginianus]|uniref:Vesicle-associated membrane protein 7 n=1 Tax=Odocoileus virginianus TaxID=9874 RepID=A0A6J0XHI5_ODOVR|nr:vesicle-associated membrane protein 714-like isoform X3 [Odocoileus virginianus texanus]
MTITYSCIANGRAVLAELALTGGSYQEAAAVVLKLVLLRAEPKMMIQMGNFVYHTLLIDGITYLCASDNALDILTPSAFLKNMKYNTNQVDSSISTLKSQVTDVKNVMTQNIDKILEREDRLNIFTDRTDDPQTTCYTYMLRKFKDFLGPLEAGREGPSLKMLALYRLVFSRTLRQPKNPPKQYRFLGGYGGNTAKRS